MAFLMSDLAAGSSAALQLQQNMAAAPYVEQQASAAAEETQLKLQQDRLKAAYAPQEAAAKTQQEEATLQKTKLANIVSESGIKITTEKSDAAKKLMADPTWATKSPSEQATAIAAAWDVVDPESAAQMRVASATYDAKQLATELKKHDLNRETIGDAYATIKSATPEQITDLISKFPENIKAAIKTKIPGFFEENDPKLQKAQLEALHLTGSNENTIATNETRKQIAEMQNGWHRDHDKVVAHIAELKRNGGGSSAGKESALELRQWNAAQRAWSRVDTDFKKPIKEAEDAWKKSTEEDKKKTGMFSFFTGGSSAIEEAKTPEAKAELKSTKAWNELQSIKKERAQKKLDAIEGMPEGKEKDKLFAGLTKELESYDIEQPPAPPKKEVGAAAPSAKDVTSTKGNAGTKDSPLPPPSDPSKLVDGMYYDLPGKGPTLYTKPKTTSTESKPASPQGQGRVMFTPEKSTSGDKGNLLSETVIPAAKDVVRVTAKALDKYSDDAQKKYLKSRLAEGNLTEAEKIRARRLGLI
jgi:hypothetical protein